jgi:hypothetical protein
VTDSGHATEFQIFLSGLASTAMLHLGEMPDPDTNETRLNLPLAAQTIDLLTMLRDKTTGNLAQEEDLFFERLLYDLRLRYVNKSRGEQKG